jgi:hypothetical protein
LADDLTLSFAISQLPFEKPGLRTAGQRTQEPGLEFIDAMTTEKWKIDGMRSINS